MEDQDLVYYQLKSEIAIEDGNLEEAVVWASLANSVATSLTARGPRVGRGDLSTEYREMLKEQVRNGEMPNLAPTGPPGQERKRYPL